MAIILRTIIQSVIAIAVLVVQLSAFGQQKPLRIAQAQNYIAPLGFYEHGALVAGLVFDITQAVGNALHLPIKYSYLPRRRLEPALLSGDADLVCYLNEGWVSNKPDSYFWSPPLFKNQTIIVGAATAPPLNSLDDLDGKTVGTVLGYFYPGLDERIASGRIHRDDAPDALSNYKKMQYARNAYVVVNSLEHDYFLKHDPLNIAFNSGVVIVNEVDLKCALSKKSPISPEALNTAVNRIVKNGLPETWLAKYR